MITSCQNNNIQQFVYQAFDNARLITENKIVLLETDESTCHFYCSKMILCIAYNSNEKLRICEIIEDDGIKVSNEEGWEFIKKVFYILY